MSAEEKEIIEFLKSFPDRFVSGVEVAKRAGTRNRFAADKNWALPFLRRMEMDGLVESNDSGEFRAKGSDTTFLEALKQPGLDLGETTIIMLDKRQQTN